MVLEPVAKLGGENGQDRGWSLNIASEPEVSRGTMLPGRVFDVVVYCFKMGYMSSSMNTRDWDRF